MGISSFAVAYSALPPIHRGAIMLKRAWFSAVLLSMVSSAAAAADPPAQKEAAPPKVAAGNPDSEAQFAWQLFAQAMKPSGGARTFETWTEQCTLNPEMAGCPAPSATAGKTRVLHGSALSHSARGAAASKAATTDNGIECNAMSTTPVGTYPPPKNVTPSAQFCEEVYVNPSEAGFVKQNGLTTLTGQQTYGASRSNAITFPWSAIEVKADWVPTSSFANPTFTCPDPTNKLYTDTINGTCYALVGI